MVSKAVDLSFGKAPMGQIEGAAVEAMARKHWERLQEIDPQEVANWRASMADHRKRMLNEQGFTKSRDMLHAVNLPMYVALMIGRDLGDPQWIQHDWKALEAVLRVIPEARLNRGSMKLDADR